MDKIEIKRLADVFSELFKAVHLQSYQGLDKLNLYPGQPQLLALIKSKEGITQKELSERKFVTPATITGMLNKLEAHKLVYRVSDQEDKRIMRVYLTEEGRRLTVQSDQFMSDLSDRVFEGFTDEEIEQYINLTDKMRKNLQSHNCNNEQKG